MLLKTALQKWKGRKKPHIPPNKFKRTENTNEFIKKNKYCCMYVDNQTGIVFALQEKGKFKGFSKLANIENTIKQFKKQGIMLSLIRR